MSCPLCGDECHCSNEQYREAGVRFRGDKRSVAEQKRRQDPTFVMDAESTEYSEQQFAGSLATSNATLERRPRFVLSPPEIESHAENVADTATELGFRIMLANGDDGGTQVWKPERHSDVAENRIVAVAEADAPEVGTAVAEAREWQDTDNPEAPSDSADPDADVSGESDWREEVAARVNSYRSRRRPRPPRYPSLKLHFGPDCSWSSAGRSAEPSRAATAMQSTFETEVVVKAEPETDSEVFAPVAQTAAEPLESTNVIVFPRPLVPVPPPEDELAEPILDKPRILDAPEDVPKELPLGGIVLDPEEPPKNTGLELPLQVAPLWLRVLAWGFDGLLIGAAATMFATIVERVAPSAISPRTFLTLCVLLPCFLWAVYQYISLVYSGTTAGMRLTRLRLSSFDGGTPSQAIRRWRVVVMGLSALSLGLGFFWCLLDEDMLCWHDRMTRTYLTYSGRGNSALLRRMFNLQGALREVVDRTLNWQ